MAKAKVTDEEIIKALAEGATPASLNISLTKIAEWKASGKITDEQIQKLNLNPSERSQLVTALSGSSATQSYVGSITADEDYILPPGYKPDPTLFAGFENFNPALQQKLVANIGAGKRYKLDGTVDKVLMPGGELVDAGLYNIDQEALEVFWSLNTEKRKEVFSTLEKHGLYFGSKPSPSFNVPKVDLEPLKTLMLIGNSLGGDIDVALQWVKQNTPPTGSGPAPVYSAREDRREALEETLQKKTGMVGDRQQFIKGSSEQIAKQERARSGSRGGEQTASLGSAAGAMVEGEFADETKAYNFAKYARILNQMAGR
jgi:hypothetical protein